ncbi:MAG TPA: sensor histidine kinase [Nocardioides sp.]|nr:sensor histidine kinase [Nocardioides sp.]
MASRPAQVAGGALGLLTYVVLTPYVTGSAVDLVENALPLGMLYVAGVVASARQPRHRAARRMLTGGTVAVSGLGLVAVYDTAWPDGSDGLTAWLFAAATVVAMDLGLPIWLDLFVVYPDGRYPARWGRPLVVVGYATGAVVATLTLLHSEIVVSGSALEEPPVAESWLPPAVTDRFDAVPVLDSAMFLVIPVALIAMLVRYSGADAAQRKQLRWPLAAIALIAFLVFVAETGIQPADWGTDSAWASIFWGLALTTVPLGLFLGMAVYHALDIDLILRRSVVYAVLWLAIAATYGGLAALLGVAASQRISVQVAVLVTIVAAMVFQPARVRLERLADRLVFGERLEGYELMRRVGATLESSGRADDVAQWLAATTRTGMQASWARVALAARPGDRPRTVAAAGVGLDDDVEPTLWAPLGEDGRLECGPRTEGGYRASDQDLLDTLARQASLAVNNAELGRELAESRARLVTAETEERRRIERDIHDGVQQQLVGLMTRLTVARTALAPHPDLARETLDEMREEIRDALAGLRDLTNGIHPPVLTDSGLLAAVESRAARLPIGVSIVWDAGAPSRRFGSQVEVAAYFTVAEALTNVLKHSGATNAEVLVSSPNGWLEVSIRDDGAGFDAAATDRRGLQGMRDRVEALGGRVTVASDVGRGTTVRVRLPATRENGVSDE